MKNLWAMMEYLISFKDGWYRPDTLDLEFPSTMTRRKMKFNMKNWPFHMTITEKEAHILATNIVLDKTNKAGYCFPDGIPKELTSDELSIVSFLQKYINDLAKYALSKSDAASGT